MNTKLTPSSPDAASLLQSRFAHRLCSHLHEASEQLPADISERLRFSRQVALQRAASKSAMAVAVGGTHGYGVVGRSLLASAAGGSSGGGDESRGRRASWLTVGLALLALALGLGWIEFRHSSHEIEATAELDAALLADDLPPEAYTDRAFLEFLREPLPTPEAHTDG
jgi:hypothetical protein